MTSKDPCSVCDSSNDSQSEGSNKKIGREDTSPMRGPNGFNDLSNFGDHMFKFDNTRIFDEDQESLWVFVSKFICCNTIKQLKKQIYNGVEMTYARQKLIQMGWADPHLMAIAKESK